MNPLKTSLLTVVVIGTIFTALLVSNYSSRPATPENDQSEAQVSAQLLAEQIDAKVAALQNSLNSLSYNTFWQSSPVAEWSYWLESQSNLFQAAGLSLVGVHSKSNDVLYFEKPSRAGQLGELKQPLERLYNQQKPVSLLKLFRDKPAIILLTPIKNIDQQSIGTLVGIKYLDIVELKRYHYLTKVPVALTKNGLIQAVSIESSPSLTDYDLVEINWPKSINSALWKLVLLVNPPPAISGMYLFLAIGVALTLLLAFVVYKQLSSSQKNILLLDDTLDVQLPIPEQINRLNTLQNLTQDVSFAELIQSIRSRIEQLVQQKKSLSIELRKSQESEKTLQATASSLTNERDSAVAAPRVKSEFLSRMGDEITTPMKSVVSMLKLLSEYEFESEPKQLLNIAKRSTRTLVDNLNNILDFSKLDAQMLKLKPSTFSVRELVDGLSAELSHYANEKGLSLQASCDPNIPPQVKADLSRIRQILRNLLGNAVRFTKQGEVSLFANVFIEGEQSYLKFAVKDSGVGIPAEAQKGLFDSLEQQTKLTNSSFAGRLRLIVSKHLAELMGGEIGVISEPGKGSQFW
ncbi:MAG: ATP-binding protein, partial [Kangiellaceae bacterium]|nr:ATP-binding protein [Kangiellaceae bacterium]